MDDVKKLSFWAKTTKDGKPGITVKQHMLNVTHVASRLLLYYQKILQNYNLNIAQVALLAGLHDIGKISPQFQRKCKAWLIQNGLEEEDRRCGWQNYTPYHAQVSQFTLERLLRKSGFGQQAAVFWAAAIGAHHGKLTYAGEKGLNPQPGMTEDEWEQVRLETAAGFAVGFDTLAQLTITADNPILWWIAGLTTIADWIASDEHFFPVEGALTLAETIEKAVQALTAIGFTRPVLKSDLLFTDVFTFNANPLQKAAGMFINQPGLYIIEAPMGIGKTEAALYAAYRLLDKGSANGIYFALPTQITSNRIHLRMMEFVGNLSKSQHNVVLIHGNSWLVDDRLTIPDIAGSPDDTEKESTAEYNWFSSPKRSLLASFGVGTIDQALMGVIAVKHFFVRQFALAGKVVILDEVHSYDMYTGTLINQLCHALAGLGATVIILSATLTAERRMELLGANAPSGTSPAAYPMISGKGTDGVCRQEDAIAPPADKKVGVIFLEEEDAVQKAWDKVCAGVSLLWICDTVAKSQVVYRAFRDKAQGSIIDVGLLHSRFPFFRREEIENEWLNKLGKENIKRTGCVLVATQIVEQSVDIDADLIVSELAPTDMLLQRIGRLWRHNRDKRPIAAPELWIVKEAFDIDASGTLEAKEIRNALGNKAYVYDPYVLLRSLFEWKQQTHINIPSGIRTILEATYSEKEHEPESWAVLKAEMLKKREILAKSALVSANFWRLPLLTDDERVMTRINSQPTVGIVLAKEKQEAAVLLLDGSFIPRKENMSGPKNPAVARAIHKNLVKVPQYVFEGEPDATYLQKYVTGGVMLGVPGKEGFLNFNRLKDGYTLKWSLTEGLEIIRAKGVTDESKE